MPEKGWFGDMEQKKLLLVVIFVGFFFVILIGAGMVLFSPRPQPASAALGAPISGTPGSIGSATGAVQTRPATSTEPSVAPASSPASADPTEWVRNPPAVPALQNPPAPSSTRGDVIIIYGDRPEVRTDGATPPAASIAADGSVLVDVAVQSPATRIEAPAASPSASAAAARPAPSTSAAKPAASAAAKSPAPKSAAAQPPKAPVIIDHYWVQTGSFSVKARADAAKEALSAKGISSVVETKDLEGKTYFRVRVGPYASKNEADYWLSLIKTIDGFDASYVSLTKVKK